MSGKKLDPPIIPKKYGEIPLCKKHQWVKVPVEFPVQISPGGMNLYIGVDHVRVCTRCYRVTNA